jgi:hypothetical protein
MRGNRKGAQAVNDDTQARIDEARKTTGDTGNAFVPCTRIRDVQLVRPSDVMHKITFAVPTHQGAQEIGAYEDRTGTPHLCILENRNAPPEVRAYRVWGPEVDLDAYGPAVVEDPKAPPTFDAVRYRHMFTVTTRSGRVVSIFRDHAGRKEKPE